MGSEWEETSLGAFNSFVYGKSLPARSRNEEGNIPVFGSGGLSGTHDTSHVKEPGIIIGRKGTVGSVIYCDEPFWPIDTTFYVTKKDNQDLRFTYYLLKTLRLDEMNADSAVPGLNRDEAHALKIRIPNYTEQLRIANVLGTLDKKIQLNRQTNQTLEHMAQALFKSWFVDFDPVIDNALLAGNDIPEPLRTRAEMRQALLGSQEKVQEESDQLHALFPSEFEHTELSNSAANAGGWVPKGWKTGPVSSIASLINKAAHPNKEPDKEWIHFSIPAFDENLRPAIDLGSSIKSGKYWVPDSSILVSKLNPETKRIWVPKLSDGESSVCSTEFMPFVPKKDDHLSFLYSLISDEGTQKEICNRATGSTGSRQRVKPKEVEAMELLLPTTDLIEYFSKLTSAWLRKKQDLVDENQSLEKLRDTLLPKLISGELRLPDVESAIEATA